MLDWSAFVQASRSVRSFKANEGKSMITKLLYPAIASAMLCGAFPPAFAAGEYVHLYGDPATESSAVRTIVITPETRYVNVECGEIIRFVVGPRTFAWSFNVARTVQAFDLNEVAPAGLLQRTVRAYVSADPKYWEAN
jgi:hypothetical protein